jgi:hypothetical protein
VTRHAHATKHRKALRVTLALHGIDRALELAAQRLAERDAKIERMLATVRVAVYRTHGEDPKEEA